MKGLLIKDLLLLKNQKRIVLLFVFLGVTMSLTMGLTSIIAYLMMMGSLLALGTFAYDEADNGYSYLFTFPFFRKTFVREKYLFISGCTLVCGVVSVLLCLLMRLAGVGDAETGLTDILSYTIPMAAVLFLIIAVSVPLRIKYGSEKSRIGIYIIAGTAGVAGVLLSKVNTSWGESLKNLVTGVDPIAGMLVLLGVSVVLLVISEVISQRIITKKEY